MPPRLLSLGFSPSAPSVLPSAFENCKIAKNYSFQQAMPHHKLTEAASSMDLHFVIASSF